MTDRDALRDALAEALHKAAFGCGGHGPFAGLHTSMQDVHRDEADAILAHPAVAAALAGSGPEAGLREALDTLLTDIHVAQERQRNGTLGPTGWAVVLESAERSVRLARLAATPTASPTDLDRFAGFVNEVAWTEVRVYDGANPDASMTLSRLVEEAKALLAASPTATGHPKDHVGLCAVPICPKYHAASPTATGERDR